MIETKEAVVPSLSQTTLPALEIRDLRKTFGKFTAVDGFSLTIQQGEIFGLLGPNGSGKTTTINMISGLSKPTSGEIKVLGYDVRRDMRQIRRILGAVPQETALYEELSAWTNLSFHADLFGIPRKEKKERITNMLKLVQLLDRKDSRVGTFSGGMKRRLALGRALLHEPQLIYLDEPTLGVDVQARRAIWDYILNLREQGKTVLITTNYLEEAQVLCDRLAIIDHGKLVALDTPQQLKQIYGAQVVDLEIIGPCEQVAQIRALSGVKDVIVADIPNGYRLQVIIEGVSHLVPQIINLASKEATLRDLSVRDPNLDEIFLRLTGASLRD